MRTTPKRPIPDFAPLWNDALAAEATDDGKRYVDAVKRAAHAAIATIGAGSATDLETLEAMLRATEAAARVAGFPGPFRRGSSKIARAMLAARGITTIETLREKRGFVTLDDALLRVGDPVRLASLIAESPHISHVKEGHLAYVSTGCEGDARITLRVTSPAPLLAPREITRSRGATATMVVAAESGKIACASYADAPPYRLCVDVEPGRYAVVCHAVGNRHLFVMAKTDVGVGTIVDEIETLEAMGDL